MNNTKIQYQLDFCINIVQQLNYLRAWICKKHKKMGKTCLYPIVIETDKNNIELYNSIYYKYIVLNMNMQSWG